ncbi:hypothetical protein AJ78_08806 [Emergomyces pasteurianus Ep9510]|uniref:Uncharacterized protein n=1 Tax=Emergomyces pasteurianus Ep9510 TaxID=1447872 RepID=A0A1J9Q220_9EURO|nr:hypothetical protein AJ78_08806 [Emergomyces pasteurianus Ep9510]
MKTLGQDTTIASERTSNRSHETLSGLGTGSADDWDPSYPRVRRPKSPPEHRGHKDKYVNPPNQEGLWIDPVTYFPRDEECTCPCSAAYSSSFLLLIPDYAHWHLVLRNTDWSSRD